MVSEASAVQYGFVIDNRRCIGCHACTVACKAEHGDPIGVNKTWVSYIEKGVFPDVSRMFHVMRCNHCADAPCVEICPTACLVTRPDGIVDFDPGRCIGCKACIQACPYDAITIHPDAGTATKCNYCSHRTDVGREPACVVVCPAQAIIAGDLNDPTTLIARLVSGGDVAVRKPEKGTRPKLYYIDGDEAALSPSATQPAITTLWGAKPPDGVAITAAERRARNGVAGGGSSSALMSMSARAQPRRTYDIPQRHARSWGWKVSAYLFTKSIAAGAFLVPALAFLAAPKADLGEIVRFLGVGVRAALVALVVTGVLLVLDLKRPERFHWVLLRPQWRSWLVRGAYIITAYGLFLSVAWLLFRGDTGSKTLFATASIVGAILAAGTAAYSGWLFGQAKGRDLWQSPIVPLHLLVQAVLAGAALFVAWPGAIPPALATATTVILAGGLAMNVVLVFLDVWGKHATADATTAARRMRCGGAGVLMWLGVLAIGHGLPLALLAMGLESGDGVGTATVAGVAALVGLAIYEHLWVAAPQRLALA